MPGALVGECGEAASRREAEPGRLSCLELKPAEPHRVNRRGRCLLFRADFSDSFPDPTHQRSAWRNMRAQRPLEPCPWNPRQTNLLQSSWLT